MVTLRKERDRLATKYGRHLACFKVNKKEMKNGVPAHGIRPVGPRKQDLCCPRPKGKTESSELAIINRNASSSEHNYAFPPRHIYEAVNEHTVRPYETFENSRIKTYSGVHHEKLSTDTHAPRANRAHGFSEIVGEEKQNSAYSGVFAWGDDSLYITEALYT